MLSCRENSRNPPSICSLCSPSFGAGAQARSKDAGDGAVGKIDLAECRDDPSRSKIRARANCGSSTRSSGVDTGEAGKCSRCACSTNSVLVKRLAHGVQALHDEIPALVLIFFFGQRRIGAQLGVLTQSTNFDQRPGRWIWLITQWPSLHGRAPDTAVIAPLLPRRSVIVPEKLYSTIACSTKDSNDSRTETVATQTAARGVAREQSGGRSDGDVSTDRQIAEYDRPG